MLPGTVFASCPETHAGRFSAVALVAQPAEIIGKELADIGNAVIIQTIHHAFDHDTGGIGSGHIRVAGQHGVFGREPFTGLSFHKVRSGCKGVNPRQDIIALQPVTGGVAQGHPLAAPWVSPLTMRFWNTITSTNRAAVIDTAAATARS